MSKKQDIIEDFASGRIILRVERHEGDMLKEILVRAKPKTHRVYLHKDNYIPAFWYSSDVEDSPYGPNGSHWYNTKSIPRPKDLFYDPDFNPDYAIMPLRDFYDLLRYKKEDIGKVYDLDEDYAPYRSADRSIIGRSVKTKSDDLRKYIITNITFDKNDYLQFIYVGNMPVTPEDLFNLYTFEDGSPCGEITE